MGATKEVRPPKRFQKTHLKGMALLLVSCPDMKLATIRVPGYLKTINISMHQSYWSIPVCTISNRYQWFFILFNVFSISVYDQNQHRTNPYCSNEKMTPIFKTLHEYCIWMV